MQFVDANIVLRYILWDHPKLAEQAQAIIEQEELDLAFEVVAEVVYVLEGVYDTTREDIRDGVSGLFKYPNIHTSDREVLEQALHIFSEKNIDFVDAVLVAYHTVRDAKVFTFDKQVKKLINASSEKRA